MKNYCPDCGGDGKETCHNPDHGFIASMPGDIGRLGCPICGHDPDHKVPNGGICNTCGGTGKYSPNLEHEYKEKTGGAFEWSDYTQENSVYTKSFTLWLIERNASLARRLEAAEKDRDGLIKRIKDYDESNACYTEWDALKMFMENIEMRNSIIAEEGKK